MSPLLFIITSVITRLLLIIASVIASLLPIITKSLLPVITVIMDPLLPIITRSIIGINGYIITYYWPGQLADVQFALQNEKISLTGFAGEIWISSLHPIWYLIVVNLFTIVSDSLCLFLAHGFSSPSIFISVLQLITVNICFKLLLLSVFWRKLEQVSWTSASVGVCIRLRVFSFCKYCGMQFGLMCIILLLHLASVMQVPRKNMVSIHYMLVCIEILREVRYWHPESHRTRASPGLLGNNVLICVVSSGLDEVAKSRPFDTIVQEWQPIRMKTRLFESRR